MREYGSFLELDLRSGREYHCGNNVIRLNTARCGIYYALRVLGLKKVMMPFYQCDCVRNYLMANGIEVSYYSIDQNLLPVLPRPPESDTALLMVNYFGILPAKMFCDYAAQYRNLIVDHAQAFYDRPVDGALNVYSARKFFGVPDGSYVVGPGVGENSDGICDFIIPEDSSADTALFLLKRIESGCEAAYGLRLQNEKRLDASGLRRMSLLTRRLLINVDYDFIRMRRIKNYALCRALYHDINLLAPDLLNCGEKCVPMVYPLVIRDEAILDYLHRNKVFTGRWWSYLTNEVPQDSMEMFLSRYLLPLPIDQRMESEDIRHIYYLITAHCGNHGGG